jgi:hypothetical protein
MLDRIQQQRANGFTSIYGEPIKKGGEGSKGGKVIGHTKSGKPVYESPDHREHLVFSKQDHKDAAGIHAKTVQKYKDMAAKEQRGSHAQQSYESYAKMYQQGVDKHNKFAENAKKDSGHKQHEDGVKHGGFSKEVWNQDHIQNYQGGYGAIYHEDRTNETDKHLEHHLKKNGLKDDEAAKFLTSRQGRHTMDAYSFGKDRVEKELPSNIKWFREENKDSKEIKKSLSPLEYQDELRKSIGAVYGDAKDALPEEELTKSANDFFEKGHKGNIGEIREYGGKKYIKTTMGWKPVGKNKGKYKQAHDTVHGDSYKHESKDGMKFEDKDKADAHDNELDDWDNDDQYGADASKLSDEELEQKYNQYKKVSSNPNFNEHGKKLLAKYETERNKRGKK